MNNEFKLHGMLFGVASAATQIEGNEKNTNWYDWYLKGKIKDNTSCDIATLHYEKYVEDTKLMKKMGIECARIGLEWARIEPEEDKFDYEVLERYKKELQLLNKYEIKPLVTIWHFSNPMWFENKGGFLCENARDIFLKYVKTVVEYLDSEVESWVTLNEPNVYALNGYMGGDWPPGENNFFKFIKVMNVFNEIHIESYKLIHSINKKAKVGTSLHVRVFVPKDDTSLYQRFATTMVAQMFQTGCAKVMNTGKKSFPYKGYEEGKYYDFIGLNYYSRSMCKGFSNGTNTNCPKNDLDWEIYPEGISELAQEYYDEYKAPIYITENGTSDNNDSFRCLYIYEHLKQLSKCKYVKRYYHWCFIDNWEWLEGMSTKFGIVQIDYPDQKRKIKKSGRFFSEIIENNGVTNKMYEEYVKDEKYNIR
ncbi:MAG: family 1 glycosylhydrolase [Erysipelotrichaceae bacterium]|nr:family 1 glycosylhydrolase [Erysipelotrichaceae bacterium]